MSNVIRSTKKSLRRYLLVLLLILLSCTPALYIPTEREATEKGVPLEELRQGRQLYVDHCGSCHMLYLPNQFSHYIWRQEVDEMQPRTRLSDREKQLILNYILAGK